MYTLLYDPEREESIIQYRSFIVFSTHLILIIFTEEMK